MDEAIALGDPSAIEPVYDAPSAFSYQGEAITAAEYRGLDATKDLACEQTKVALNCEDSLSDLRGIETAPPTARGEQRQRGGGCAFGYNDLYTYKQDNYDGDVALLNPTGGWYDLGGGLNDETSSFITGNKSAHLSENEGGFGYWFPGDTSQCTFRASLVGTDWNNRISSRKRVTGS